MPAPPSWHVPCGGVAYGDANTVFIANDGHTALVPIYLQVREGGGWVGAGVVGGPAIQAGGSDRGVAVSATR